MKHGIDISYAQGDINFASLKEHTDFVIIRAGFGKLASQKDEYFERNYKGCKKNSIPCGAYWFSYAHSPQEASLEAKACIEAIKGKKFAYPIYYDVEGTALSGGIETVSEMCKSFCSALEKAGYFVGIYMSASPMASLLDESVKKRYALWAADYAPTLDYSGKVGMWQNSSTGEISGISGNVDTDICYEDYPEIIKKAGLSGYGKKKRKKHKASPCEC